MGETEKRLVTVNEAARILALRPSTVRVWCYQRRLARVRIGKRAIRIPLTEIHRIIRDGTELAVKEA
jgi:excisionase family DNA binding protein